VPLLRSDFDRAKAARFGLVAEVAQAAQEERNSPPSHRATEENQQGRPFRNREGHSEIKTALNNKKWRRFSPAKFAYALTTFEKHLTGALRHSERSEESLCGCVLCSSGFTLLLFPFVFVVPGFSSALALW
jgi:hypothetical protein